MSVGINGDFSGEGTAPVDVEPAAARFAALAFAICSRRAVEDVRAAADGEIMPGESTVKVVDTVDALE